MLKIFAFLNFNRKSSYAALSLGSLTVIKKFNFLLSDNFFLFLLGIKKNFYFYDMKYQESYLFY